MEHGAWSMEEKVYLSLLIPCAMRYANYDNNIFDS
jgi:hypothetical protein